MAGSTAAPGSGQASAGCPASGPFRGAGRLGRLRSVRAWNRLVGWEPKAGCSKCGWSSGSESRTCSRTRRRKAALSCRVDSSAAPVRGFSTAQQMIWMVFRTRQSPSSRPSGSSGQGPRELRADGGGPDEVEVPGRVGPVVPLPNVGADAGPSRRVRVKTRYLPAKGLEGTAHRGRARPAWFCGMLVVVGPVPEYSIVTASGGARRRLSRALMRMRWAWEMTRLTSGSPCRGNRSRAAWSASARGCSRGSSTRIQVRKSKMARVAPHVLRELVVPAVGEVVEQLAVLELPLHRGAREVVHDRGELAEVAEQQELDFAVHGDAGDVVPQPRVELRDLFRHQPVDVAVPVPDGAPRPVVGRLRLHAEVLHGGVGLRDDLDLVPFFPEGGHDLARQVGFPGARVARQQQASAFEAVQHGVFRDLPVHRAAVRTLGLDSGDPVLALEALDLLAPIHGRAVGMLFADQAVHEALELFGQVLEDDAVRLHGLQVPRRHGGQCIPDAADRDVLRGHHEVVHGPTAPVGQQLGHVDVVPVHPARGVQEQLPVLAAGAVELVVAGAHGVDEVHVARPEPDEGVHRQLRVVLLSLRPGRLHLLQGLGHGLLVHVRRGVQAPREVAPGRDALFGLGVPALAHVGEAREGRPAPVLRELHVGQVRQVPLAGLLHVVLGAEDGCRELAVGQGVLAAPDHVYSVADPLRLVAVELEDQRGQPGRFHVGLVSPPAEAGLQRRGVRELQGRFVPVALEAQGLEVLGLCGEGLVHGDDVVQLARRHGDGRRAELALVIRRALRR